MHIKKRSRITSALVSLLLVFSLVPSSIVLAAGNTLYVTPSSQSLQPGQSFTVQVKGAVESSFLGADTVSGTLTFPANLLQVTSVSTSGATFNWQVSATPGNGVVNFSERSFFPQDNPNVFVMAVTFKALTNGTASVGFTSNSGYSYNGSAYPTTRTGGTYTISTPPPATCPSGQVGTPPNCTTPTCPSGQTGTPPNCTTPKCPTGQTGTPPNCTTPKCPTGQTGTPPNCTTPSKPSTPSTPSKPSTPAPAPSTPEPTVVTPEAIQKNDTEFSIEDPLTTRSYKKATLNWTTEIASKAKVEYGTSLKQLDKTIEATKLPDGTFEAVVPDLTPGKQYYFTITATSEADASKTSTYSGVFTTKGFPVVVNITENNTPAASAKLKISEQNYSADKSGKATLELASGTYTIEVKTAKGSKTVKLAVANKSINDDGDAPETQRFTFDIPTSAATTTNNSSLPLGLIGGIIGGIALLAAALFFFLRRKSKDENGDTATVQIASDYNNWQQPEQPLPSFPQDQPYVGQQAQMNPGTPMDVYQDPQYTDPTAIPPVEQAVENIVPDAIPPQTQQYDAATMSPSEQSIDYQGQIPTEYAQASYPEQSPPVVDQQPIRQPAAPEVQAAAPMPPAEPPQQEAPVATPSTVTGATITGSDLQIQHSPQQATAASPTVTSEQPVDTYDAAKQQQS